MFIGNHVGIPFLGVKHTPPRLRTTVKGFVHWDFFGRSIGGTGGGENEFLAVGFNHGMHEVERSADVVFEERQGLFHRFAHFDVGGEVDDSFGLKILCDPAQRRRIF